MSEQAVIKPVQLPNDKVYGLDSNHWVKWSLYLLMAFPVVDYALRLEKIHVLGMIWDKVVLLILMIAALARYTAGSPFPRFRWYKYAGWFLLFGFALMIADFASPIIAIQGYRIDVYYVLFAFFIPILVSREDVIRLLHIGASIAILIAVHGIYQYIVKTPIPPGFVDVAEHVRTRAFSVLASPNELGAYMALMTPIVIGLALYETNRWRKWMYLIGGVLCAVTLLLTFTRGAWAALAISLLLTAILFERRLLIVLVVLGVIGYFLPPIHHRIADLFSPAYMIKAAQPGGRIARWLTAFDKLSSSPLLGVGLGHYGGAVASDYGLSVYSDNYYAKTFGETGLIGLTLFLAMQLALANDLFQNARSHRGRVRYVLIGGLTGIVAVLIHNSLENVFEDAPMAASYFIYTALFLVLGGRLAKESAHDEA